MERRADEFSFEGAWDKQFKEEKEKTAPKEQSDVKVQEEVKKHDSPAVSYTHLTLPTTD